MRASKKKKRGLTEMQQEEYVQIQNALKELYGLVKVKYVNKMDDIKAFIQFSHLGFKLFEINGNVNETLKDMYQMSVSQIEFHLMHLNKRQKL